jgi:hypothetical protein
VSFNDKDEVNIVHRHCNNAIEKLDFWFSKDEISYFRFRESHRWCEIPDDEDDEDNDYNDYNDEDILLIWNAAFNPLL